MKLGQEGMKDVAVLSGGTDGEDGPTDAAGAVADENLFAQLRPGTSHLQSAKKHDVYPLFDACGSLILTGLTQTNVMDVRVILMS